MSPAPNLSIADLRFEHHPTGLGVESEPRLSWRYEGAAKNWAQSSFEVEVKRHVSGVEKTHGFTVVGQNSFLNEWPDSPLRSRERAQVRVKAHGSSTSEGGNSKSFSTEWTRWTPVEATLLEKEDWKAKFICTSVPEAERDTGGKGIRPIRLVKKFDASATPALARMYITALGLYEAYINGKRVGDEHMAPGWTSYGSRLQYQVYDVTAHIRPGKPNVLAVEVAEGWYAGRLAWAEFRHLWGSEIGALVQLELYDDSAATEPSSRVVSDESWSTALSPITSSEIYDGEAYDMRIEDERWTDVSSLLSGWKHARLLPFPKAQLVPSAVAGVKVKQIVKPVSITKSPSGKTIVDFGQNLVGRLQIRSLKRPAGHKLSIRHAEVLENGELAMRPLRRAKATDTIIFSDAGKLKDWSPHFTFHGFRYVDFDGWSADDKTDPVTLESVSALVMHTDLERTGHFECSNELVNKLHQNVVWSMRGNFFSIPTDCPQRDERLGWTGDIQVFSPTASFLYDCSGMLSNWMKDLIADQKDAGGIVPFVVPNVLQYTGFPTKSQAIWDDVVILLPWVLYNWFGDVDVLRQNYDGMKWHLEKAPRADDGLWDPSVWQLGDWLDPNAPPSEPGLGRTDGALVADEYLAHAYDVIAKIAAILSNTADAVKYTAEAARLRTAFHAKYIAPSGLIVGDSQTSLALALIFALHGLSPDFPANDTIAAQRTRAGDRLARLVRYAKFRVSTGFAGTPAILHALSSSSNLQLAYRMLLEEECPSWMYVVRMGGTTVWERWDSMLPDGTVNPGEMTSFNHYALGAVADWLHAVVGGVRPLEPGWRVFAVEPRPGGDVRSARVEFLAQSGWVKCKWVVEEDKRFKMTVLVPPNSTAKVVLPNHGGDMEKRREETVGSGEYEFECDWVSEV